MNSNRTTWIWIVVIIVIVALGLWWWSASQSNSMSPSQEATTTVATTTTATTVPQPYPRTQSSSNVAYIAEHISGATQFASLLESTGVGATIQAGGNNQYTIFVPTDGAFSLLPSGTISSMTAAQLKRLVQYHVVSGRAIDATAQTAGQIQALSGDALNFSDTSTNIPEVNSSIIVAEYDGTNGVVYLINGVLLPPQTSTQ